MSKFRNSLSHAQNAMSINTTKLPAVSSIMLPLFGRTRKTPNISGFNEEWVVPSEQELYGRSKNEPIETVQLKTVEEESNEVDSVEQMTTNNCDCDIILSDITTKDGESFADETFSVIEPDLQEADVIVDSIEIEVIDDDSLPPKDNLESIMARLTILERKFEEINAKISKMGSASSNCDSNQSIFVNEFVNAIQDLMKTGMSYQQKIVGTFIEELDQMFDIDIRDFDPFK